MRVYVRDSEHTQMHTRHGVDAPLLSLLDFINLLQNQCGPISSALHPGSVIYARCNFSII